MQHTTQQSISLESILVTALDKMQQLLTVLLNETSALERNELKGQESITEEKSILTKQIEKK